MDAFRIVAVLDDKDQRLGVILPAAFYGGGQEFHLPVGDRETYSWMTGEELNKMNRRDRSMHPEIDKKH